MSINLLDDDEVVYLFSSNRVVVGDLTLEAFIKPEVVEQPGSVGPVVASTVAQGPEVGQASEPLPLEGGGPGVTDPKVVAPGVDLSQEHEHGIALPPSLAQLLCNPSFVQLVAPEVARDLGMLPPQQHSVSSHVASTQLLGTAHVSASDPSGIAQGSNNVVDDEHVDVESPSMEQADKEECILWDVYCDEKDKSGEAIDEDEFHQVWKKARKERWERVERIARKGKAKGKKRKFAQGEVEHFGFQPFEQVHEHLVISVPPSNVGREIVEHIAPGLVENEPDRTKDETPRGSSGAPAVSANVTRSEHVEADVQPVGRAGGKSSSQLKVFTKLMNKVVRVKYKGDFGQFVYDVLQDPPVLASFMARVEHGALHNDQLEEALDISGGDL